MSLVFVHLIIIYYIKCIGQVFIYQEIIRELREDRGLKQADVASVLGTTQQVYSRYEKGINEMPIRHLITLSRFYGVSSDYILGLNDDK